MTTYYVGPGGNDGNSGLTWALRKLTLNGAEDIPVAAGDVVYVGPGVYRELLTVDVSGGSTYVVGTVTVTNGSTTITGAGTAFLANVAAADLFHVALFASGNDGVANGTATFTSAAGNFQANMVGKVIQINTRGAYVIGAVAAANSITLTDPNGLGWPAAAGGLTYSVMSGEGHYEIDSVTDNTNFELVRPWCGPTLTGLAYIAFTPIRYIADETGENTDGVGGIVRITGSDNDQTTARTQAINIQFLNYRLFRGFHLDLTSQYLVYLLQATHVVIEDCTFYGCSLTGIYLWGAANNNTVRRCIFHSNKYLATELTSAATRDDIGYVVENCSIFAGHHSAGLRTNRVGGITVKGCTFWGVNKCIDILNALATGQTVTVNNSILEASRLGFEGANLGDITENCNSLFNNLTDRVNCAIGANSVTYPSLPALPLLVDGYKLPWWFGELSEWSQIRALAGTFEACGDLRGFVRPVTSAKKSWGALQFTDMERDIGTVYAGVASMELLDAGRIQFKVPCTSRPYMVRVRVQREANYAGTNPQVVIKQPGQADRVTVDVGAASAWNLLEDTFTPAADPEYFIVELVSNNTAAAGNYATYFDNLEIRGDSQQPGQFEHWMWDRQPFEVLPSTALVLRGREYRRRRMPGEVSAMEEQ